MIRPEANLCCKKKKRIPTQESLMPPEHRIHQVSASISLVPADFSNQETMAFLYRVYRSTRIDEISATGWPADQVEIFLNQQFQFQHRDYINRFPGADFFIVTVNQTPCGRLYLDSAQDMVRIIDIALLPEFRGKGIGSRLITEVQSKARFRSCPVNLHVENTNPCYRLYRRLEFKDISSDGLYTAMSWRAGDPSGE
jgi:GNAT superfamily N-acetyltransferase